MVTVKARIIVALALLVSLAGPVSLASASVQDGLAAWWPFDGDANDLSGNGCNGWPYGDPTYVEGVVGGAVELDGNDSIDGTNVDLPNTATISLWVNPASTNDGQCFIGKNSSAGGNLLLMGFWGGGYQISIRIAGPSFAPPDVELTTGWQHLVVVVEEVSGDASDISFYKDSLLIGTARTAAVIGDLTGKPWAIGQEWDSSTKRSDFFTGQIDDVRLYRRALDAKEVEQLYNLQSPVVYDVNSVPSFALERGQEACFHVRWPGHPQAEFYFSADAPPAGPMTLKPLAFMDNEWLFAYESDSADCDSIEVTITAADPCDQIVSSFNIDPIGPQQNAPVIYDIGSIPAIAARKGGSFLAGLSWSGHSNTSYSIEARPQPDGLLGVFEEAGQWTFYYDPAGTDQDSFAVTITADDGAETFERVFDVVPLPRDVNDTSVAEVNDLGSTTVWHGDSLIHYITWPEHPDAAFGLQVDAPPLGPLGVLQDPNGWLFYYSPDSNDLAAFEVTLTAQDGAATDQTAFVLTPMPRLVPEHEAFGLQSHTQPSPLSREVRKSDVADIDGGAVERNYELPAHLHDVSFSGRTVVVEAGSGIFDDYNGARNIKTFTITADTVIVRERFRLPMADVTICARELRFEGRDAQICTTPVEKTDKAQTGADGLDAGDISLKVHRLYSDYSGVRFNARGGNGQPATEGAHGADGPDVATLELSEGCFHWCHPTLHQPCFDYCPPQGYDITYYGVAYGGEFYEWGSKTRPDAEDAQAGGQPGDGGQGGSVTSNIELSPYVCILAGDAGRPALPSTPPYDRYKGGSVTSTHYVWLTTQHVQFPLPWGQFIHTPMLWSAKVGEDAPLKFGHSGEAGEYACTQDPFEWLNPTIFNYALQSAKDEYLGGYYDEARERIEALIEVLEQYRQEPAWGGLSEMDGFDLDRTYEELRTLDAQLLGQLDYFGNPAGWVPMLSFEYTMAMFDAEIDRSITMLYLTYWLGRKADTAEAREAGIEQLQDKLEAELVDYGAEFVQLTEEALPDLKERATAIGDSIADSMEELASLEQKLVAKAEKNLEPKWWQKGLRVVGNALKMSPWANPWINALGKSIVDVSKVDLIGGDTSDWWGDLQKLGGIGKDLLSDEINHTAAVVKAAGKCAGGDVGGGLKQLWAPLKDTFTYMKDGFVDIKDMICEPSVDNAEVQAELDRLRAQSDEYNELVEEIEELQEQKQQYQARLSDAMMRISALVDLMGENTLAYERASENLDNTDVLADGLLSYIDNIERRAYDRLLKYHYYMAKAYEYRVLKPYEHTLDLGELMKRIIEFADADPCSPELTTGQFESLKGVFEEAIANVVGDIYDDAVSNPGEQNHILFHTLTQEELDTLNTQLDVVGAQVYETLDLDLMEAMKFPMEEEDIRIVDIEVSDFQTEPVGGPYEPDSTVELEFAHSGISRLRSEGRTYLFRHYAEETKQLIKWEDRLFPATGQIEHGGPSEAEQSLLRMLLGISEKPTEGIMLYSRPAAWTKLDVVKKVGKNAGRDIRITNARFKVYYDYRYKPAGIVDKDFAVMVPDAGSIPPVSPMMSPGFGGAATMLNAGGSAVDFKKVKLSPLFVAGRNDKNGRADGRGAFRRVYNQASGSGSYVEVTAAAHYGNYLFYKWTDEYGNDFPGGPYIDPTLRVALQYDGRYAAVYVPWDLLAGDLNHDRAVDMRDFSLLAGSWCSTDFSCDLAEGEPEGFIDGMDLGVMASNWLRTWDGLFGAEPPLSPLTVGGHSGEREGAVYVDVEGGRLRVVE